MGEMLRPEFALSTWKPEKIDRHTIIYTNFRNPRHSVETLFEAVVLLKQKYSDIRLLIAGQANFDSGYGAYVRSLASKLTILDRISFLGRLNGYEMAHVLSKAHIFVLPSLIENSPNSLCEAQMVGMPCISSYTGGVPSIIEDGKTGLFFPPGDSPVLAHCINSIFKSDKLAISLGSAARQTAMIRHNPDAIAKALIGAYRDMISRYKGN